MSVDPRTAGCQDVDGPGNASTDPTDDSLLPALIPPSALQPPPGEYADPIPGVIPFGSTTCFVGSPHAGKTIELTDLATRLRDGRPFCGHATNAQPVGIITTDHRWAIDQGYWFDKAGWATIPHVSLRDRTIGQINWHVFKNNPAEKHKVLRKCLDYLALPPGSTLIIDVGQPFICGKMNDYNEVMAGLNSLSDVTYYEYKLTLVCTAHMAKQKGDDQQYKKVHERIAGSVALVGFTDTIMYLQTPEDAGTDYYELGIIPRRGKEEQHPFIHDPATGLFIPFTGQTHYNVHDEHGKFTGKNAERLAMLLELIPEEGIETAELFGRAIDAAGGSLSRATFFRDIEKLEEQGRIRRVKHGWIDRAKPA